MKKMKLLYVIVPIIMITYFVGWISYNIKENRLIEQINREYLNKNKFYLEGEISSAEHLNGTATYTLYVNIDSLYIESKFTTDCIYWGFINSKTKKAVLFARIHLYNDKISIKDSFPDRISIDTKLHRIFYYKNGDLIGESIIYIENKIVKPKFKRMTAGLLEDKDWVKF